MFRAWMNLINRKGIDEYNKKQKETNLSNTYIAVHARQFSKCFVKLYNIF